jgi:polysaccharide pyruvyl transferase WcaK-like protein
MKRIIVHCSTNFGSSNFGDAIFANIILKKLLSRGFEVSFFQLSKPMFNYLYVFNNNKYYRFGIKRADLALYFAGGYFGEPVKNLFRRRLIHYFRFFEFGRRVLKYRKKIAVVGIGGGPHLWRPSRKIVTKICEEASIIATRDIETTDFLNSLSPSTHIITLSDIAQSQSINDFVNTRDDPRIYGDFIFLHVNDSSSVANLFAKSIKPLLASNPSLNVVVGSDCITNINSTYSLVSDIIGEKKVFRFEYSEPDSLCHVLNQAKLILTYKLHVGIFGAAFCKSVVAVYKNAKVKRYFKQINELDRCRSMEESTQSELETLVQKYFDKPITLSIDIFNMANMNWKIIDQFIGSIDDKQIK